MVSTLRRFPQYDSLRNNRYNFQVFEDFTPPPTRPSSPILYGLLARLRHMSGNAIAIFDTSALMEHPGILRTTVRNGVAAVIPYTVIEELDGLKKSDKRHKAMRAHRELDELSGKNGHPLLFLESSRESREPMVGFYIGSADDNILKCALRISKFMSDRMRKIYFVVDDIILRPKSRANDPQMSALGGQDFVNGLLVESGNRIYPYSPCSSSSPEQSSSSIDRSIDNPCHRQRINNACVRVPVWNTQPVTSDVPSKRPMKRKGLSVVDLNVTHNKRFRFEENYVDDESIERKRLEEKKLERLSEEYRILTTLEERLDDIDREIVTVNHRFVALASIRKREGHSVVESNIEETLMRRRVLRRYERLTERQYESMDKRLKLH